MTTTVHIAVSGNKQVLVTCDKQQTVMQPGAHTTFLIHGDVKIEAKEFGGFIDKPSIPLIRPIVEDPAQGDLIKGVPDTDDSIAING